MAEPTAVGAVDPGAAPPRAPRGRGSIAAETLESIGRQRHSVSFSNVLYGPSGGEAVAEG
jgi:hypothetical protein